MENNENENQFEAPVINPDELQQSPAPYDYYDNYYISVLNRLDTIIDNEEIIIDNQDDIKSQNDTIIFGINTITFVIVLILIYNFLRNMINVR